MPDPLDADLLLASLRELGELLEAATGPINIVLIGGGAGLLLGALDPARTTADCDVVAVEPDSVWESVRSCAAQVAIQRRLPESWLNRDSAAFAWMLPLGWRNRCQMLHQFGPLRVHVISRQDLIASKIISAPKRPQDLEDLRQLKPTESDLVFAENNLLRVEAESLNNEVLDDQRTIIRVLRKT